MKYNVRLMPGWPLRWWIDLIHSESCSLGDTALVQNGGSAAFLTKSNHRRGTLVKLSALLCSDLTRSTSTDSPYSLTRLTSASSRHLISISLVALVRTLAFPMRVSVTHLCTHAESVWICNVVASHISVMFMPFSTASSSAKFMCCVSLALRSQLASSTTALSCSRDTPVAKELASTQTSNSGPSIYHFPYTGSFWCTLATTSVIIVVNGTSVTSSSQPLVTSAALLLMNDAATLSHVTTGKCPTNFLQNENILRRVRTCGTLGTSFPRSHISILSFCRTVRPSARAPFCSHSGSLLFSPKLAKCCFTLVAETMSWLMKTSSMYAEVACRTASSFENAASTIAHMIDGAILSLKPMRKRQYLFPSKITVWYGHKDLCTRTCKYALRRSSTDTLEPFFLHSLNFCTQTSACAV